MRLGNSGRLRRVCSTKRLFSFAADVLDQVKILSGSFKEILNLDCTQLWRFRSHCHPEKHSSYAAGFRCRTASIQRRNLTAGLLPRKYQVRVTLHRRSLLMGRGETHLKQEGSSFHYEPPERYRSTTFPLLLVPRFSPEAAHTSPGLQVWM